MQVRKLTTVEDVDDALAHLSDALRLANSRERRSLERIRDALLDTRLVLARKPAESRPVRMSAEG